MNASLKIFLATMLLAFSCGLFADDRGSKEKQLSQLLNRIDKLKKTIEVKENSRSSFTRQLRQIEKQIGKVSAQIRKTTRSVSQKRREIKSLQKQQNTLRGNISQHNQDIARQLYAAYTLGHQEQLKLLFSQNNATHLQRNLIYYQYFSNFRLQQIKQAEQEIQQLISTEKQLAEARQSLENTLQQQRQQKQQLDQDRNKRHQVVRQLEKDLKKQGHFLTRLEDDAENLKQLIDSLSEILTDTPAGKYANKTFPELTGKLAWPVKGRVQKLFGRPKPPSNLRWQGVIINAKVGNNVRAVSHGRVAFADWLRGMGNLVIIDHGNGYLSLYGHNESIFKEAGEWVEAGDIIGSIGDSGGQQQPGLYFEIRKKGKPQNPSRWCRSENWFATS